MAKRIVFAGTGTPIGGALTPTYGNRGGDTRDYSGASVSAGAPRYARPGRLAGVTTRTARNDSNGFFLAIGAGVDLDGTSPLYVCVRNDTTSTTSELLTWLNTTDVAGSSPYAFDISPGKANENQSSYPSNAIPDVKRGKIANRRYVPVGGCVAHGLVFVLCRLFVYGTSWEEKGVAICYSQTEGPDDTQRVGKHWDLWWEEPGPDYVQPGRERGAPWAIQNYFTTYRHATTTPTVMWFPFGDYIRGTSGSASTAATRATFYLTRASRGQAGVKWNLGHDNNDKAVRMIERVAPDPTHGETNNCHAHSAAVCLNTDSGQSDEMFYVGSVGDNLPNNCAIKWRLPDGQDWDSSSWTRVTFDSAGTSSPGPFEWHGAITNSSYNPLVYALGSQHIASCPGAEQETVLCGGDTSYDWIYRADMVSAGRAYFRWCHGLSRVDGTSKEVFIMTTPTTEKGGPFVAVCPLAGGTTSVSAENLQRRLLCEVLYSLDGVEWTVVHTGPVHPRAQAHILGGVIVITDDGSAHGGDGDQQRGLSTLPVPTLTSSRRPLVCAPGGSIYAREATDSGATSYQTWYLQGQAGTRTPYGLAPDCPSPLAGLSRNVMKWTCASAGSGDPDDIGFFGVALNDLVVPSPAPSPQPYRVRTWVRVLRADGQDLISWLNTRESGSGNIQNQSTSATNIKWLVSLDRWFPIDVVENAYGGFVGSQPWGILTKLARDYQFKWGQFAAVCEGQLIDSKSPGRWPMPKNTQSLPASAPDTPTAYSDEKLTVSGFSCGQYWVAFVAVRIPDDAFDDFDTNDPLNPIPASVGFYDLFTLVESSTKFVNVRAIRGNLQHSTPIQSSIQVRFVNGGTTVTMSSSPVAWERGAPVLLRLESGSLADENFSVAVNGGSLSSQLAIALLPDIRPSTFLTGDQNGSMNAPVEVFGLQVWESASGAPSAATAFADLTFLSLT